MFFADYPVFSVSIIIAAVFMFLAAIVCLVLILSGSGKEKKKKIETTGCVHCGYTTRPDFIVCPKCGKMLDGRDAQAQGEQKEEKL